MESNRANLGFMGLHNLGFRFKGVFQCRLATNDDPATEPRGKVGWTYAYAEEPDLDRTIRFNNPESPRLHAPEVGVLIINAISDSQYVNDSLVGHPINLGNESYFDGSQGAQGLEPIMNFEFHVGDDDGSLIVKPETFHAEEVGITQVYHFPCHLKHWLIPGFKS